jgi:hypothetical protein
MNISYHPTIHPLPSPPFRDHGCASSCTHTSHRLVVTRSHFLNRCESSWDMANITKFHINAMEMQRHRFRIDLQQALSPFCFTLQSMICYIIAKYIEILIKLVLYRLQVPDRTTENWGTLLWSPQAHPCAPLFSFSASSSSTLPETFKKTKSVSPLKPYENKPSIC